MLRAGDSSDRIYGDAAGRDAWPDVLDGGPGEDLVSYQGREGGVQIDLVSAAPQGSPGDGDLLAGFERAEGGAGRDVILGDDGPNHLTSGVGGPVDVLEGGRGDDGLDGAADRTPTAAVRATTVSASIWRRGRIHGTTRVRA